MIANKIDHTLLKPTATQKDIEQLCREAVEHGFRAVCVNSCWVKVAKDCLDKQIYRDDWCSTEIAAVIGFPFGACATEAKILECVTAKLHGATEFDVVWNIGLFKSERPLHVMLELNYLVKIVAPLRVKVIVESGYLNKTEQKIAHSIVKDSGAHCIKTSTGYCPEDNLINKLLTVLLWEELGDLEIKASGGIKCYDTAQRFLAAGAGILGTSSGKSILLGEDGAISPDTHVNVD